MVVPPLLLAALIAVVNGGTNFWNKPTYNRRVVEIASTTNCRFIIQVTYPLEEGAQPMCTSLCPKAEEAMWVDGVVYKKLAALAEFNLMMEMTYIRGTLQNCKLVPSQAAEEQVTAHEQNKCPEPNLWNEDTSQEEVEAVIPSATELIPTSAPSTLSKSINKQLQGFTKLGYSYYMTSHTTMTWDEADRFCKRNKALLAFIESATEQSYLRGALTNDVWIGLHDRAAEGIFANQNNTPIRYSNWNDHEPNNKWGVEDCVMLQGEEESKWNDQRCSNKNYALCERPVVHDSHKYKCPRRYWLFQSSCYIMSTTKDTYSAGKNFCSAKGAYPVFINSLAEHNFVAGKATSRMFIGYTDIYAQGTFVSSHFGLPLFKRWNRGEPNNFDNVEDCVTMEARFQYCWNDTDCNLKDMIMCEKPAEVVD